MYALFSHGTIQTSETKAKAIKGLVDKVINFAKEKNIHNLQSYISDKSLRERLVKEVAPKLGARNSGYTKLIRIGTRVGDQTNMVRMSLIESEEMKPISKENVSRVEKPRDTSNTSKTSDTSKRKTKVKTK